MEENEIYVSYFLSRNIACSFRSEHMNLNSAEIRRPVVSLLGIKQ